MYGEAWSYNMLQKPDSMASVLKAMVKKYPKEPSSADALFTIGDFYYNKQQYHEAMIAYSQIIADFPAYTRLEEAKSLVHELDQITAYLEYEKAMQLFDAKNYAVAITDLEKVLTKYPGTDIALGCRANIASGYEQMGQLKKAREIFQKILDEYRDVAEAYEVTIFAQQHVRWIEAKL
jgi:TolA-binding protein